MFVAFGQKYYEIGDSVTQSSYPGCPGIVVEIKEYPGELRPTVYRVKINVQGHPEGVDENGEPVDYKILGFTSDRLEII